MMKISVKYFARVREALGAGEELQFADGEPGCPGTVGDLRRWLAGRSARHAEALAEHHVLRSACDQVMCGPGERLRDGAEVAFFPPVTGG